MLTTFARFVIYVFGMVFFGIIFASSLSNSSSASSDTWDAVGNVPGTVTELFYVYPNIYVRTSDNLLYVCDRDQQICSLTDLNTPPSDLLADRYCYEPETDLSQLRGTVVSSLSTRECAADGYVDIHIAALDDGSIWIRYSGDSAYSGLFQFVCMAAGGFVGLLIGLYMFWRSRKHKTPEKAKR